MPERLSAGLVGRLPSNPAHTRHPALSEGCAKTARGCINGAGQPMAGRRQRFAWQNACEPPSHHLQSCAQSQRPPNATHAWPASWHSLAPERLHRAS